jgi:hypothetical protein
MGEDAGERESRRVRCHVRLSREDIPGSTGPDRAGPETWVGSYVVCLVA